MSLNVVTLVGRAGRDAKITYFDSGSAVCQFSLAVSRRSRNTDQPDWFEVEIWDSANSRIKTAQNAADYIRKGTLVGITGSFKLDRWQDRATGVARSKPVIRADDFRLLGSKRDNEGYEGMTDYNV